MQQHVEPLSGDSAPSEYAIAYFRDPFGTLFAAELVRSRRWDPAFEQPPDPRVADVRVVEVPAESRPRQVPPWLVVDSDHRIQEPGRLAGPAARAWVHSPHHREPGPAPAEFVAAGFQALCPPHPPCPPGPHARGALVAFAQLRGGSIGHLAHEGRDGFDRWLRVCWPEPSTFARDILLERLRDAGALDAIEAIEFLDAADVAPEAAEYLELRTDRIALRERLHPLRYFTERPDFERACADALRWRSRFEAAYLADLRRLVRMAEEVAEEVAEAVEASDQLDRWNGRNHGSAVGQDALDRLRIATQEIARVPSRPDLAQALAGGVLIGRVPPAFAEARLAAAAILAALDVHRHRESPV